MSFADIMSKKVQKTLEKNLSKKTLTMENMEATIKEFRLILLEADVNFRVVKTLTNEIINKAKGEFIKEGLDQKEMLIKIIHDELTKIMGTKNVELDLSTNPTVIMIVGLQGSGKTTTISKLAKLLTDKYQKKCLLVAGDIYRPAAVEQLKVLGKQLNIEVFSQKNETPTNIVKNAQIYANKNKFDVILIDTAGRLHIDEKLMQELAEIRKITSPKEVLLVCDGMAGQDIINVAIEFNNTIPITGSIITKLDGTAKGGSALSISYLTKIPVKFLGMGEKVTDLEIFYPERMAERILGMGDLTTLMEKAESIVSTRDVEETMNRMMLGQFDLNDLVNQMKQIQKMGKLGSLVKMIPGMSAKISDAKISDAETDLKIAEYIIASTTAQEREKPQILRYPTRKARVLKGSGRSEKELNKVLNQFEKTKKVMDQIAGQIKKGEMPNIPGLDKLIKS
ncbi:signal recognition particle protein [Spiroplasma endosymbiont of Danaus chrysippus]|uniref:signal recognition particle protein n=1 Tax=Spiroplasma endosymbiont of Danaus chrysippus TaxID=2691041 RepID=UPI00157ACA92|nr:signal recognition particle protein [Spiroplasma endosymbiont of Danaus chrysippus]